MRVKRTFAVIALSVNDDVFVAEEFGKHILLRGIRIFSMSD